MGEQRRAVLFRDGVGYLREGQIFYPPALKSVAAALSELVSEKMELPRYFHEYAGLALDMIYGRFAGVHDTHAAACEVQGEYCERGTQYCLYLRSFFAAGLEFNYREEADGSVKASEGFLTADWRMRSFAAETLMDRMPMLGCINHGDVTVSNLRGADSPRDFSIPSFSVQSHNWKEILEQLIGGANCVVLYLYGHSLTEGIQFEIDTLQKYSMEGRCLVAAGEANIAPDGGAKGFRDVFMGDTPGERERLAAALRSLAAEDFRQSRPVKDLSAMKCYVVDRMIEPAFTQFDAETLRGLEYTDFIPSSLANNWKILWKNYPPLSDGWRTMVEGIRENRIPGTQQLAASMLTALKCFCLAATLELYDQMAGSLEIVGAAHRTITKSAEIWEICFRFAAKCAEWAGNEPAARFFRETLAAG